MTRPEPLPASWTALLAHFTALAQRALALPQTPDADRLRHAVPHLIALQGLAHSLDHLDRLGLEERAVALDRGEVILRDHLAALHALYAREPMPDALRACIDDASRALKGARSIGQAWVVTADALITEHPAPLVAALLSAGFAGDLTLPSPGVTLFRTCPCAFIREHDSLSIDDALLALVGLFLGQKQRLCRGPTTARPMQVYRQFDFARAGAVRDVVRPLDADPVAGQPLLVPAILEGLAQPVPLPPRAAAPIQPLPVEFQDE